MVGVCGWWGEGVHGGGVWVVGESVHGGGVWVVGLGCAWWWVRVSLVPSYFSPRVNCLYCFGSSILKSL